MSQPSNYIVPSVFATVLGSALHDEFSELRKTIWRRGRKRFADYILGPPSYYNSRSRKVYDRSLKGMRFTSVRRRATRAHIRRMAKRRTSRGRKRRVRSRTPLRRARARRAMGTNGPAFRSRLRRTKYRANIGERIGFCPSRRFLLQNTVSTAEDKRLHTTRLIAVQYSDDDQIMNCRTGRLVDVIGVKFRAWFQLKSQLSEASPVFQDPIQVRWAIINPRENSGNNSDVTTGNNFFQSDSPGTDDSTDFPLTGNAFKYMNRKINVRRYGVLQEGSFLLSNDPGSSDTRVAPTAKKFISFYVPVYRQMKWGDNDLGAGGYYPNANLHFVYWFVRMADKDTPQIFVSPIDQPFDFNYEHITYFRNPDILNG